MTNTGKDALIATLRAYAMPASSIAWLNSINAQTGEEAWGACSEPAWLLAFAYRSASFINRTEMKQKFIELLRDEIDVTTFADQSEQDAYVAAVNRLIVAINPVEPSRITLFDVVRNLPVSDGNFQLKRGCMILAELIMRIPFNADALLQDFASSLQAQRAARLKTNPNLEKYGTSSVIRTKIPWSALTDAQDCILFHRRLLGVDLPIVRVTPSVTRSI